jgi:ribonucleoside-diphosphate reductase alpha chain
MSILQKYIDQGISVNTSYNPQHYEDEKIPKSEMLKHIVMFYKYGGKQLYYFNTYDGSGEIDAVVIDDYGANRYGTIAEPEPKEN